MLQDPITERIADTALYACFLLVPLSIAIAVMRSHLWDIDVIINRALVYGTLTALVVGLYMLVVSGLGALLQMTNYLISLAATGLVAALFSPVRDRLQRGVDRLMYGERDDPYRVISLLGQQLEAAVAPDALLLTVAQSIRDTLRLQYVAIEPAEGEGAAVGAVVTDQVRMRLLHRGEAVGELVIGRRAGEENLSPRDAALLRDLARQASAAVFATRLTADLQRSRERLVTAREEERRRLRRDLHDGFGSRLAALNLQAGALRGLIRRDPTEAEQMAVELRQEVRDAIADLCRLVYGLRPPALDELGLMGALRQRAMQCGLDDGRRMYVIVDGPEALPGLPAAVEVAAYRIAEEALTNVVRHSGASHCTIRVTVSDGLVLEVSDDGVGLPHTHQAGVGELSMRERAEELGGTCLLESRREGGARVLARLPLSKE